MLKVLSFLIPSRQNRVWLYRLSEDESFTSKYIIFDKFFENEWLIINPVNNTIVVKKGYAWDGCTPKYNFFDVFVCGVPEGRLNVFTGKPYTWKASLFHDALCQFKDDIGDKVSTGEVHLLFEEQLSSFQLTPLYLWFIKTFGPHR